MNETDYLHVLILAGPESILVISALLVLAIDLLVMRSEPIAYRSMLAGAVSGLGCLIAVFWLINVDQHGAVGEGMLVIDRLTRLAKAGVLVLTLFTVAFSIQGRFTEHIGEYYALVLMATVGMLFLVSAENLLMIFLALELTSLSLYILTAFNKRNPRSAEAALKYFLFGGMAAAFTLFGFSLVYGISGAIELQAIASGLRTFAANPLLWAGLIMTLVGFGFKIAAVPFHLWAPDAYDGAPTPSAALIASGSKMASFFILAKVLMMGFDGVGGSGAWRDFVAGWMPLVAVLAAFSMVLGNLAALAQRNVKRLLAYSAIAHAGYALLGILADSSAGIASLVYYVFTYGLTALGAFGVVSILEQNDREAQLTDFAGLARRAPALAFCMMVFMLSLAGIPPLAGFIGKFYLFAAAAGGGGHELGLLWLVILAIAMSAVSLYYYLQVLKQMYVAEERAAAAPVAAGAVTAGAVWVLAALVILLGCAPGLLLEPLAGFAASGW